MALKDLLNNAQPAPNRRARCSMGQLIETLNDETTPTIDELMAALGTDENPGLDAPVIFEALKEDGHRVSLQGINRHRGGRCGCNR